MIFNVNQRVVLFYFYLVVPFHISFRFGGSFRNQTAQFMTAFKLIATSPERTIFGDVSVNLETFTLIPGPFSGMERVVLSSNGNLQRILSAYYGAPLTVKIKRCVEVSNNTFDREVDLLVHGKIAYTAVGQITIYSEECRSAMEERNIGIGQLFQHFKTLPSFRLLRAGRRLVSLHDRSSESGDLSYSLEEEGPSSEKSTFSHTKTGKVPVLLPTDQSNNYDYTSESSSSGGDGNGSDNKDAADMYSIWREYELFSEHLHCRFVERFSPNFLNLGLSPSL